MDRWTDGRRVSLLACCEGQNLVDTCKHWDMREQQKSLISSQSSWLSMSAVVMDTASQTQSDSSLVSKTRATLLLIKLLISVDEYHQIHLSSHKNSDKKEPQPRAGVNSLKEEHKAGKTRGSDRQRVS